MKTVVHLCRLLVKNEEIIGWWTRRVELPIPPFEGLSVCLRGIDDSHAICEVWITPKGAVVCELLPDKWSVGNAAGDDCTERQWNDEQFAYETEGWVRTENFENLDPAAQPLRPAVQWLAEQMERRLSDNDNKATLPRPTMEECVTQINNYWHNWIHEHYQLDHENDPVQVRWNLVNMANWFLLLLGKDVNEK